MVERIVAFNRGREPERLALKYAAIASDPFRFLRGTCHLFYEDFPRRGALTGSRHAPDHGSHSLGPSFPGGCPGG